MSLTPPSCDVLFNRSLFLALLSFFVSLGSLLSLCVQSLILWYYRYKKNLKQLYIIHPTMWVKGIMKLFKPFISRYLLQIYIYIYVPVVLAYSSSSLLLFYLLIFYLPHLCSKFWQKVVYVQDIHDIYKFINKDQLKLPDSVFQYVIFLSYFSLLSFLYSFSSPSLLSCSFVVSLLWHLSTTTHVVVWFLL